MARWNFLQSNFTAGEISPKLLGNVNLEKYRQGAETIENYIVMPQGGVTRRPGSFFIAETKDSSLYQDKKVRLIPWEFSETDAYVIEAGNGYFRFFKNGGRIEVAGTPVEITTPYTDAQLFDIDFSQAADVMYIVHGSHQIRKLSRLSDTSWTLTAVEFENGPYSLPYTTTPGTMTPSGTTGGITVTCSQPILSAAWNGIRLFLNGGQVRITSNISTTQSNATVLATLTGVGADADWLEDSFSSRRGWPAAITFFEQRLVLGGTTSEPNAIFASVSQAFEDFEQGSAADDAWSFTIASGKINAVQWLSSLRTLLIGTRGDEFRLTGSGGPVTPTNGDLRLQSSHGSVRVRPVSMYSANVFVQKAAKRIRQLQYSQDTDVYNANDLTALADHITGSGVVQIDYQQEPQNVLWAVRDDGVLAGMTISQEFGVSAWHRHLTRGNFESVAVIPSSDGTTDELWASVKRIKELDTPSLYSLFEFNETSGVLLTESVNERTGRYIEMGPAQSMTPFDKGVIGNGVNFHKRGHIEAETEAFPPAGDFSVAFFLKLNTAWNSSSVGTQYCIAYQDDDSRNDCRVNFNGVNVPGNPDTESGGASLRGRLLFRVWQVGFGYRTIQSDSQAWTANVWYFVGCTYSKTGGMRMYIAQMNDVTTVEQTDNYPGFNRDGTPYPRHLVLGSHAWTSDWGRAGQFLDGMMDHLRIYSASLTKDQMDYLFRSVKRYVERFTYDTLSDSSLKYEGVTAASVSGCGHLEGLNSDVFVDGGLQNRKVVSSSGVVTLDKPGKLVIIGLQYKSKIVPVRLEEYGPTGTSQGNPKSFSNLFVRLKDSMGMKINGKPLIFQTGAGPLDITPALFTGDKSILALGWSRDGKITIEQEDPLGSTVLAVFGTLEVNPN